LSLVLADTSVWIDYLRDRAPTADEVARLLEAGQLITCGPVLAELLAGAGEGQRMELRFALAELPFAEVDRAAWREAGELSSELGRRGARVPLLDVLIGVAASRARATLSGRGTPTSRASQRR